MATDSSNLSLIKRNEVPTRLQAATFALKWPEELKKFPIVIK